MIKIEHSESCFYITGKKAVQLIEKPITAQLHSDEPIYAYVIETNGNNTARLFKASSDVDAIIKAQHQMNLKEDQTIYIGISLGKDESGSVVFKDICKMEKMEEKKKPLNEEISDRLAREIQREAFRIANQLQRLDDQEKKQDLLGALQLLTLAQVQNEESRARQLLSLAKRVK